MYRKSQSIFSHGSLDFTIEDKDQSTSNSSQSISTCTFEEGLESFLGLDFGKAVSSTFIGPLFFWFFRLHLQTSSNSIKWIRGISGHNSGELGNKEF